MQTVIEKLNILMESAKTGRIFQGRANEYDTWTDSNLKEWVGPYELRLKPTPTLRPWRIEEVPLEAWFRLKPTDWLERCVGIGPEGIQFSNRNSLLSLRGIMNDWEWSLTPLDPTSWKPCGVEE